MVVRGSIVAARFQVLRRCGSSGAVIVLARDSQNSERVLLAHMALTASAAQVSLAIEQQARFAIGVPGLVRPFASGVDGGFAFLAYPAPAIGSVAELHRQAWPGARVAALATRLAAALGPLHDQGIAHGCLRPELVAEGESGEVLFGFGIAAIATAFGAPGEASQLQPPEYRAPELRASLQPPTPASDIFGFSCLLRELLSSLAETVTESGGARAEPSTSRRSAGGAWSAELEACLARGASENARERPREVRSFAAEFARLALMEPKPASEREGTASEREGTASEREGTASEREGTASEREGTASEREGTASEREGTASEREGTASEREGQSTGGTLALGDAGSGGVGGERARATASKWPLAEAPFAPAPFASARRGSALGVGLLVGAGVLLMVGGVIGASVYAARRAPAFKAVIVSAPLVPAVPKPAGPSPRPSPPGTAEGDAPPFPDGAPPLTLQVPPQKIKPSREALSSHHALLVAPGVGPASFREEAAAALPVLGSEPIWGTRNAPLTWVVFGDLDCPHTRRMWRALEAEKVEFGDDLRIVFRHRPLREHPHAEDAARVLAGLARRLGARAFFDVLHRIAEDDGELTRERLGVLLRAAGHGELSLMELEEEGKSAVSDDLRLAGQFAVRSTPSAFLNGKRVEGERSPAELERLLDDERRSVAWSAASGVPAAALYVSRTSSNLIGVGAPGEARVCAPIGDSPVRGPDDALVTVVEFADFECPFCKRAEPTLRALFERYPKTLRLIWKNFPLSQHKAAHLLANFAADVSARGSREKFWAVHDALFREPSAPDDGALGVLAGKAGLDGALLVTSAHAGVHEAAIQADLRLGEKLGVQGTPTFFVNGRRVQGALALEALDILIREELVSAQRIVARGVARADVYGLLCR